MNHPFWGIPIFGNTHIGLGMIEFDINLPRWPGGGVCAVFFSYVFASCF